MRTALAHLLHGSLYDLLWPGLFLLGLLALGVYLVFRVFAGRGAPGRPATINAARRGEPTDESRDGTNGA